MNRYQLTILSFGLLTTLSAVYKFKQENNNTYNYKSISYYQVYSLNKPQKLTFCGEEVPMQSALVRKKIDKEVYHYNHLRNKTHRIIKRVEKWLPRMEKIIIENGLPPDLKYLAVVESNLSNVVSHKGAAGYWQFMKTTAISMGLEVNENTDERYNPIKSTKAACKYFKAAHRHFGNWVNSAASYNIGITGLQRQMNVQQKKSYFDLRLNKETAGYVYRAIALKEIIENKEKYGFHEEFHYHEPLQPAQHETNILNILFFK